jgi:hypothetical protein
VSLVDGVTVDFLDCVADTIELFAGGFLAAELDICLVLLASKAGKSSACRLAEVVADWEAMVFDKPVLVASVFTSCLACAVVASTSLSLGLLRTGVVGLATRDSGVATRMMLREGVKGADVGTILDGGFVVEVASSRIGK